MGGGGGGGREQIVLVISDLNKISIIIINCRHGVWLRCNYYSQTTQFQTPTETLNMVLNQINHFILSCLYHWKAYELRNPMTASVLSLFFKSKAIYLYYTK